MMPHIELVGDFVEERFILASPPGRVRWTEQTKSLDRLGGVFLTKSLLSRCYKQKVELGCDSLPKNLGECKYQRETLSPNSLVYYSDLYELNPKSRLVARVVQRQPFELKQEWSIRGQLNKLKNNLKKHPQTKDYLLFVEQEEYTNRPRDQEMHEIFEFTKDNHVSLLFLKTNRPYLALEQARKAAKSKPTIMLTTLRALNGNALARHTWDAAVRHVLRQLMNVPEWMQVGIELWNEGCLWVYQNQGFLVWDTGRQLGEHRLCGKGWAPGSMNVTCASLLSYMNEPNWPTTRHVIDSWVLSRQCTFLGYTNGNDEILDLPEQLYYLLNQDKTARPRGAAFGIAKFIRPAVDKIDDWSFLKNVKVRKDLVEKVVIGGPGMLQDKNCPFLRVGKLFEINETTIEQLLTLNHLLRDYAARQLAPRPLSIAVFGPAGSGKSFSVTQLVRSSDFPQEPAFFSYNLSQLRSADDLEPAFHTVQSAVLRGYLPIVFWDEFDTAVEGQKLGWLKYFLGPMQEGEFFVRGTAHPLGRCIFVFAGATAHSYIDFMSRNDTDSNDAKLPDFISRIKAWLDVPQLPSALTPAGKLHRAILVHTLMRRHASHINVIEEDVIKFLVSDKFMTVRALERVIEAAALSDTNRFTLARLLFTPDTKV